MSAGIKLSRGLSQVDVDVPSSARTTIVYDAVIKEVPYS